MIAALSYGALLRRGLDDVLDDEGRPLLERRAPSAVKAGVAIVLKPSPYADAREGKPMNVSALAQVSRHIEVVLDDIASLRAATRHDGTGWEPVLTAVVDGLGAPALHVLRAPGRRVPARASVAHKLAAGYFGVVRGLLAAEALGGRRPVSTDDLLAYAHDTRAFVGASEACAGPPAMVRRATEILVRGRDGAPALDDRVRIEVATAFRQQVQVGITWEQFDVTTASTVLELLGGGRVRTQFFAARVADARRAVFDRATLPPRPTGEGIPTDLAPELAVALRAAVAATAPVDDGIRARIAALPASEAGGVEFSGEGERTRMLDAFARYLSSYAAVIGVLVALERRIRLCVGIPTDAPIELNEIVLPAPTALHWMESALGVRTTCPATLRPEVTVTSVRAHRAELA